MKPLPRWFLLICRFALLLLVPVVITLTNVRLLMTPLFPTIEYNLPYFPADPYGFTKDQRLFWSKRSIDYILARPSAANISAWKFPEDGLAPEGTQAPAESCGDYGAEYGPRDCTYFYNDREVKHMIDVQNVTRGALAVWAITGALALLASGALFVSGEHAALRGSLLSGVGIAVILYLGIIFYIALNFNQLFVQFHQVFFEGGTWRFLWSDSLIRLFPVTFWRDAFIFIGGASLAEAAALGWAASKKW